MMSEDTEEYKGILEERKDGIVIIDTSIWMRPITACKYLRKKGVKVSRSLMNYWKNENKIENKDIEALNGLTLVNIETIPKEVRVKQKIE